MKFTIKKIAPDKWKHFFVGIPLGAALQYSSMYILHKYSIIVKCFVAFLLLLLICYGFELFSKITGKGHYEMWDAIAGALGGIIGIAIIAMMY